jgi:hypothetical protein
MFEDNPPPKYPWAVLYDLESGVIKLPQARPEGTPGRPTKPYKRFKTSVTFTDEEKRIYEKLSYVLGGKLHPNNVTKGQVLGLALRLLDTQVEALPTSLQSWEELADYIFEQKGRKRK